MRQTPSAPQINGDLARARAASNIAKQVRMRYRRTSNPGGEREKPLQDAFDACAKAARPLRKYIGMLPYHPELTAYDERLREASADLTYQRRRLRKMLR